ncbi:MAG TPA: SagB/ThcOx family dehydrogenase [Candidatus Omnitrophica bacterium]|nr:SagB/ThcOx family dehydrogenase [Candidatus Omnitrophota bacterium]
MKRIYLLLTSLAIIIGNLFIKEINLAETGEINLPPPKIEGKLSLEEVLSQRRSRRTYKDESLRIEEISQILWAAQGITAKWGGRTTPSAGALYPLEIYLVVGKVEDLGPGIYHYQPRDHSLRRLIEGDKRWSLFSACLFQSSLKDAPVSFVICASYPRTTKKYGKRGRRYVHMEVGCAIQNIYLQAESLGLGTVAIGAFVDKAVKKILNIPEEPLCIMPIGRR